MLSYVGMSKNGLYRISDSDDGSVDYVTYEELFHCVAELGIAIQGVIFAKRTGTLLIEQIRGGGKYRKSTAYFKEEVYNLVGDDYSVLSEYSTNNTGVLFRHNVCGYEYIQTPRLFLDGKRCPKCFRLVKETTDSFKQFMKSEVGEEYSLLSEYTGANDRITVRHNKCGRVYNVSAANFKRGQRCPDCTKSGPHVKTFDDISALVKARSADYELITYNGLRVMSKFRHLVCGSVFDMLPDTFLRLHGQCPVCSTSVPERLIQMELQKWFECECNLWPDWLRAQSGYKLELDIYIPSLKTGIEYDSYGFHRDRVHNDTFKDISCSKCGVRMIRLREYGLPKLGSDSVQILATKPVRLNRFEGLDEFGRMMTELLRILGVDSNYVVDAELVKRLYDNSLLPGRR